MDFVFTDHQAVNDECARRLLAALREKPEDDARSKATDGYAIAADVLEGSEV